MTKYNSRNNELNSEIMNKEAINKRFLEVVNYLLATKKAVSKGELANVLGIKATKFSEILNSRMGIGTDLAAMVCMKYEICPNWLLTGRGSMLKQNVQNEIDSTQTTENALISSDKDKQNSSINQEETSYIYKMFQEEKADWKTEKREKDSKIDHLQSELRSMTEELATLKVLHFQSQNKESEHHSSVDKVLETFTSDLSGDYGEGFLPTKQPTTSEKSSVGKI